MCMFDVLKSVGKCDKITDVKYLLKMALQLNNYKSKVFNHSKLGFNQSASNSSEKIGRVAEVEDSLYARISDTS